MEEKETGGITRERLLGIECRLLESYGYGIVDVLEDPLNDVVDIVADDAESDCLVFLHAELREKPEPGKSPFPPARADVSRVPEFECAASGWLESHPDAPKKRIRFDSLYMVRLGDNLVMTKHYAGIQEGGSDD